MTETLLPCPFCGSEDNSENALQESPVGVTAFKAATGGYAVRVTCSCGAAGKPSYKSPEAIAAWNTRASTESSEPIVAMPEELSPQLEVVWDSAFHAQLRKRHKHRFKPDCKCDSAEASAWRAVRKAIAKAQP